MDPAQAATVIQKHRRGHLVRRWLRAKKEPAAFVGALPQPTDDIGDAVDGIMASSEQQFAEENRKVKKYKALLIRERASP